MFTRQILACVRVALVVAGIGVAARSARSEEKIDFALNCRADNDLYAAMTASMIPCSRYSTAGEAVDASAPGTSVLILADGYPQATTAVDAEVLTRASTKGLTLYIEYPAAIPGMEVGVPRKTDWERIVVATDRFGDSLPRLAILMAQDCRFTPMSAVDPMLVVGRVAGFDHAVFGLPRQSQPILFELPDRRLVIAATKLSGFIKGRYAPAKEWQQLWEHLLGRLSGGKRIVLRCSPVVRPAYGPMDVLPADCERQSLAAFNRWIIDGRLLVSRDREAEIHDLLRRNAELAPVPAASRPSGDGSCGVLEGFTSVITADGGQEQRVPLRTDCHAETAMCMALDWALSRSVPNRRIAENLLDYVFFTSGAQRGVRGDPRHPAFGHIAWGLISPAWEIAGYGDDNARLICAAIVAGAVLKTDRWDEPILRALLANLRTTGRHGFRGDRIDLRPLEQLGWRHFQEAETIRLSPHYESALWSCYLWAYARTQHQPFLDKARTAIGMTMEAYPERWLWRNNLERARMILCLAWLVRVEDTPQHREWLTRVIEDMLEFQDACGAIAETPGHKGSGHGQSPTSDEEYGTREMPIVQDEGDAGCDQLYVSGFALEALHEANAILDVPRWREAEDKLAAFLCRIQVHSDTLTYLSGGWFRAFDFRRWEYWAGSGDSGWGAWSLEAGWGQAWGAATMGLRALKTNMWDLSAGSRIGLHIKAVQELMAVNDGGPWRPATRPAE